MVKAAPIKPDTIVVTWELVPGNAIPYIADKIA
jgi:hypothetical protein